MSDTWNYRSTFPNGILALLASQYLTQLDGTAFYEVPTGDHWELVNLSWKWKICYYLETIPLCKKAPIFVTYTLTEKKLGLQERTSLPSIKNPANRSWGWHIYAVFSTFISENSPFALLTGLQWPKSKVARKHCKKTCMPSKFMMHTT